MEKVGKLRSGYAAGLRGWGNHGKHRKHGKALRRTARRMLCCFRKLRNLAKELIADAVA